MIILWVYKNFVSFFCCKFNYSSLLISLSIFVINSMAQIKLRQWAKWRLNTQWLAQVFISNTANQTRNWLQSMKSDAFIKLLTLLSHPINDLVILWHILSLLYPPLRILPKHPPQILFFPFKCTQRYYFYASRISITSSHLYLHKSFFIALNHPIHPQNKFCL